MIDLLFRLPNLIAPASAVAAPVSERTTAPETIGFVVLAIIVGPVIMLTIAAMFEAPRTFRVPGLFIGALVLLIGAMIAGFAIVSALLRFIVPQ